MIGFWKLFVPLPLRCFAQSQSCTLEGAWRLAPFGLFALETDLNRKTLTVHYPGIFREMGRRLVDEYYSNQSQASSVYTCRRAQSPLERSSGSRIQRGVDKDGRWIRIRRENSRETLRSISIDAHNVSARPKWSAEKSHGIRVPHHLDDDGNQERPQGSWVAVRENTVTESWEWSL